MSDECDMRTESTGMHGMRTMLQRDENDGTSRMMTQMWGSQCPAPMGVGDLNFNSEVVQERCA